MRPLSFPWPLLVAEDENRMTGERVALGELLRVARERRGLSLQQIAHETKIPQRHLEALERGDLDALPGAAYRRGEVVAFADAVGVEREVALQHLDRATRGSEGTIEAAPNAAAAKPRGRSNAFFPVLGAIAAAAAAAWFVERPSTPHGEPGDRPAPAASTPSPPQSASDAAAANAQRAPAAPEAASAPATASPPQERERVTTSAVPRERQSQAAAATPAATPATQEATRSAPASPARERTLIIVTEPSGARVTVNGIGWGTTPLSLTQLPPGPKQIRVTLEGYAAQARTVQLRDTGTTRVVIPLRPQSTP
jgi:cytoskeletal protein RodZ